MEKGYLIELVGNSYRPGVSSANLYYELEIQRDFERDEDVRRWMKNYLDFDGSRILPGSENSTLIRHVRKNVISGLSEYLSDMKAINISPEEIDSCEGYGYYVNLIHINNSWVHFDKHSLYPAFNENLSVPEVNGIFGISD